MPSKEFLRAKWYDRVGKVYHVVVRSILSSSFEDSLDIELEFLDIDELYSVNIDTDGKED